MYACKPSRFCMAFWTHPLGRIASFYYYNSHFLVTSRTKSPKWTWWAPSWHYAHRIKSPTLRTVSVRPNLLQRDFQCSHYYMHPLSRLEGIEHIGGNKILTLTDVLLRKQATSTCQQPCGSRGKLGLKSQHLETMGLQSREGVHEFLTPIEEA